MKAWQQSNLQRLPAEVGSWQKQETRKGIDPIAGTLDGGWGFYCWSESVGGETVTRSYSATEASAMVASGAVTNRPVFSCSGTPLNNRNATQDDIWLSLAKYVPAISSPVGGSSALNRNNVNLNEVNDSCSRLTVIVLGNLPRDEVTLRYGIMKD